MSLTHTETETVFNILENLKFSILKQYLTYILQNQNKFKFFFIY